MIVVLADRPKTDRSIKRVVLAMTKTTAAVIARTRGRSREPAGFLASTQPHRVQHALSPGGIGGMRCSKSQSGQATDDDNERSLNTELPQCRTPLSPYT